MVFNRQVKAIAIAGCALLLAGPAWPQDSQSSLGGLPLSDIEAIASEAYDAGELEEAILFWTAAANRGSVSAMVSLAVTYQEIGGSGDRKRVEDWYRAAAREGDVIARVSLADLLLQKDPPQTKEARTLLQQAADADNVYAQERLKALGGAKPTN